MDGTYTATGKSTKTGGLPGTPSGTPPGGVLGGSSGGSSGGRNFSPPKKTVRGQEKPEKCRFWGFLGVFREKGHFGRFPISNPTQIWPKPPFWAGAPRAPEIDPPGVGHPGGEKVHIFEGI